MTEVFTKQEKIFICFLLFGVLVGSAIELYRSYFKTTVKIAQADNIEYFENHFHQKAALIDSLLNERTIVDNREKNEDVNNVISNKESRKKSNRAIFQVEINRATFDELVSVPQIGRVIANRIIEYRNAHGKFKDIEELIKIKGIGEKKLKVLKPYIYIEQN